MSHVDLLSPPAQDILIFGDRVGGDRDRVAPSAFVVEFLKFIASCANINHILYSARLTEAEAVVKDTEIASGIAGNGFVVKNEADDNETTLGAQGLLVVCVSCHATAVFSNCIDLCRKHQLGCHYRRLHKLCTGRAKEANSSSIGQRLVDHILDQLATTKVQVASEFDYTRDVICAILAKQYLSNRHSFDSAGSFIGALFDFEEGMLMNSVEPAAICAGIHDRIRRYREGDRSEIARVSRSRDEEQPAEPQNALMTETMTLMLQTACKKCLKRNAEYVLLPCTHYALCQMCRSTSSACPFCGADIMEVIRAFM